MVVVIAPTVIKPFPSLVAYVLRHGQTNLLDLNSGLRKMDWMIDQAMPNIATELRKFALVEIEKFYDRAYAYAMMTEGKLSDWKSN